MEEMRLRRRFAAGCGAAHPGRQDLCQRQNGHRDGRESKTG